MKKKQAPPCCPQFWVAPYKWLFDNLKSYYQSFGGIKEYIRAPYIHLSIVIGVLTYSEEGQNFWYSLPITILPSVLGLTIAGFAVVVTFGDEQFKTFLLKHVNGNKPAYSIINSTFIHFIIIQVLAICYAAICYLNNIISGYLAIIGYIIFILAIIYSLAVAFAITKMSTIHFDYIKLIRNRRVKKVRLSAKRKHGYKIY